MIVVNHSAVIFVYMMCYVMVRCEVVKNNKTINKNMLDSDGDGVIENSYKNELGELDKFEPRKKTSSESNQELLKKILPMLATPFILQATFFPMVLLGIKFMLIQSIFLGKLAIIFWTVNLIRNKLLDQQGQFYSHNVHLPHN